MSEVLEHRELNVRVGCACVVVSDEGLVVGVKCTHGRGIILPGGKWEKDRETFKQCASRELFEETGLVATNHRLIFNGFNTDGFYNYVFLTEVESLDTLKSSSEGEAGLYQWNEFYGSIFRSMYEMIYDSIDYLVV